MIPNMQLAFKFALPGVLLAVCGCASFHQQDRIDKLDRGLTLVLPGVEGEGLLSNSMAKGLEDGNVRGAIEVHDWTSGQPIRSLEHLVSIQQNHREADRLANRIIGYRDLHPDGMLHLVGHSGGAAIIAMAVSRLPETCRIDQIVLLAPAISRSFPISEVARRAETIHLFRSPVDFQLTIGTSLFGSIDRRFGPSAGSYGFREQPGNLNEIAYHPSMIRQGNPGGHLGCTHYRFVRDWVAPLLWPSKLEDDAWASRRLRIERLAQIHESETTDSVDQ